MNRLFFGLMVTALAFYGLPAANGETHVGSLTYSPPTPPDSADALWVEGKNWPAFTAAMSWTVTDEDDSYEGFLWKYTYNFQLTSGETLKGGISHLILECSEDMPVGDITGVTGEAALASVELQRVTSGNPEMPEDVWGIRFNPIAADEYDMTWSFWSNRLPDWGDFYVKDGGKPDNIAYNYNETGTVKLGFLSPDVDPNTPRWSNPVGLYHVLRPGAPVPEPGALVLLVMAGLGVLAYVWRRRRS